MQANWALVRWFPWFQGQSSSLRQVSLRVRQDNGEGPEGGGGDRQTPEKYSCTPSASSPWEWHWPGLMVLGRGHTALLCQLSQKGVLTLASVV